MFALMLVWTSAGQNAFGLSRNYWQADHGHETTSAEGKTEAGDAVTEAVTVSGVDGGLLAGSGRKRGSFPRYPPYPYTFPSTSTEVVTKGK